jgi:methylmalonyl-CoA/ethylmalonyl-CoA epimerase
MAPSRARPIPDSRQSRSVGGRLGSVDAALASAVPGFVCIDHLGIAVPAGELEAHVRTYLALGFTEVHREDVHGTDQVREVLMQIGDGPNLVQLLEPLTPASPIAAHLARNGGRGGVAHVALRVADVQVAFDAMRGAGFRVIDAAPRPGSRGTTVFFVHPKTTDAAAFGYVLEIVQEGVRR